MVIYRRFPVVKTSNTSKTSVGTENKKALKVGQTVAIK